MHIRKLLYKTFLETAQKIDKRNHSTLIDSAITLSECQHLSITALGRH